MALIRGHVMLLFIPHLRAPASGHTYLWPQYVTKSILNLRLGELHLNLLLLTITQKYSINHIKGCLSGRTSHHRN